jgi:hypothetical protein
MTDISSCFDQIIPSIISLKNRKNGCPKSAVEMHALTLEHGRYYLKTRNGISTSFYSHSDETPIYGNGQGAGDSPSQWCQQSTILFDLYAEMNPGANMSSPDKQIQAIIPLAAFADDTNLIGNDDDSSKTIPDLVKQAQTAFSTWNKLLHATQHFLELSKCACYLSIWDFEEDGYAYTLDPDDLNKEILVEDLQGRKQSITKLAATTSQKLLGVMKNPIGNQQDEIARLQTKSDNMAKRIYTHALSRTKARLADFEMIQQKITSILLASLGYNRNMPREVIFCSQKFQGLGLKHLYDIQGSDSTKMLTQELNTNSGTTYTMLKILLQVIQQEAGIQEPILEETRPLQYIEWGWIPSIRDFLHHINAKVMNATMGLSIYRENDNLIMDSPLIHKMSRKDQILINRCRLALQVECLSDITDAEGKKIHPAWFQNTSNKPSKSMIRWPRQGDPGREAWSIWKRFITQAFTMHDNLL